MIVTFFNLLHLTPYLVLQAVMINPYNISLACLLKVSSKFHIEQEQRRRELQPNLVKSIKKKAASILMGFATGLSYSKSKSAPFRQSQHWQKDDGTLAKWHEDVGT